MTTIHRFSFPTDIRFGAGARREVAGHLRERGLRRPLIVTDRALGALPLLGEFRATLDGLEVAVFDGVFGNPGADQVDAGVAAFAAHAADCVIGFGGGAALDVAKLVALMSVHDGDVIDYAWDQPAPRPIERPLPWFVALPTTAGTGSEVGRAAVVSEVDSHVKRTVFGPQLLARAVFADPELCLGLPAAVTAATGIDALTHNIESYLSPVWHPMCDGIALEGLRLGARSLPTAVAEPGNLAARSDMMISSMMGAVAFQKDLGAVHACAHALGAVCGLHHGLANALMIEPVMAFNLDAVPVKFDELAHAAGLRGGGAALLPWLHQLKQTVGIGGTLADHGVERAQLDRLVALAAADVCGRTNPRAVGADDFRRFFEQAF